MKKYQTESRKKLVEYFENSNHRSVSAKEMFDELQNQDISMSAIYRNLALMEKEGLICKITEKNRQEAHYQYVDPTSCVGVIHLKCQSCESTIHLNRNISQMLVKFAKDEHNFAVNNTALLLYGECENCSQNQA